MDTSKFFDWIKEQPDDRKLNMGNASFFPNSSTECGCLMIQFAQDQGHKGKIMANFSSVELETDGVWDAVLFPERTGELIHALALRKEMTFAQVRATPAFKRVTA